MKRVCSLQMRWLNPILKQLGLTAIDKDVVRKIAHVVEFFLLSILTSIFWKRKPIRNLYTGLIVALLDETIQVFTGRGALVTDIWIDMIGVGIGTVIVATVEALKRRQNKRDGGTDE